MIDAAPQQKSRSVPHHPEKYATLPESLHAAADKTLPHRTPVGANITRWTEDLRGATTCAAQRVLALQAKPPEMNIEPGSAPICHTELLRLRCVAAQYA